MKRILHIGMSGNLGGIEQFIYNIYQVIDKTKIQFDFLVFMEDRIAYEDEIVNLGGVIHRINCSRKKNPFRFYRELDTFFQHQRQYSAVHVHVNTLSFIAPIKFAEKYNNKIIFHSHSAYRNKMNHTLFFHSINRFFLNLNHYEKFACSELAAQSMFGQQVKVINNGIDTNKFSFCQLTRNKRREELNIEDKFVVGHIGRFGLPKNHTFLIDIFSEIYKKNSLAVLLLVGEGELSSQIKEKVTNLGLGNHVHFLGKRTDISELLCSMDVFLFPSLFEGLGMVLVEAQASGLPCFTSAKVVPEEVKLTDLVEFVSLEDSAKIWAEKVLAYQSGYERRNRQEEIEDAGYDVGATVKVLEEVYCNIST